MLRRGAVIAAGLALAASFGLAGVGTASAAAPALKIQNGATWTIELNGGECQLDHFSSQGTFASPDPEFQGDAGTWSGGGPTITMKWTAGDDTGLKFKGTFTRQPVKEYLGKFGGIAKGSTGQLVKGAVPDC